MDFHFIVQNPPRILASAARLTPRLTFALLTLACAATGDAGCESAASTDSAISAIRSRAT
jgi:hypothetical protein